jgi:hypothetical protein
MGETLLKDTERHTQGAGDVSIEWTDAEWTHRQYMAFLTLLFTPRRAASDAKSAERPAQTL